MEELPQNPNEIIEGTEPSEPALLEKMNFTKKGLIGLILVVAVLLGYIMWNVLGGSFGPISAPDVKVWFDTDGQAISGSNTDFTIYYENNGGKSLGSMQLEIVYPSGFEFVESTPRSRAGTGRNYLLPDLNPGEIGSVAVTGIFSGSPQEIKLIKAKLTFIEEGTTATFSKDAESQVSLTSPNFNMRLIATPEIQNSQILDYEVVIKNISDKDAGDLQLRLTFPSGFSFLDSSIPPVQENTWTIEKLKVGQEQVITMSGTLTGQPGSRKDARADLGYASNGDFFVASRASVSTVIQEAPLLVSHLIESGSAIASEGDTVTYLITYENKGTQGLSNVQVKADLEGSALDLSTARTVGGALIGSSLIWNASGNQGLALLLPGQKGELRFTVRLRRDLTTRKIQNPEMITRVAITSTELPNYIPGNEVQVKVRSAISMKAEILGVVSGPQRPQVGVESTYRIRFSVTNNVNKINTAIWLAFINTPAVTLQENSVQIAEGQDFQQNLASGRITWRIGDMDPFQVTTAEFLVKVTPSVADKNNTIDLIRNMSVGATDDFVQQNVAAQQNVFLITDSVE